MHAQALEPHQWLHRLRGEWIYECTALRGGGEPSETARGHEIVRGLGELWVVCGAKGCLPGGARADTQGPSITAPDTLAHYRDIIEWLDDDHRVLTSQLLGRDGRWTPMMISHYHRTRWRPEVTLQ